MRHIQTILVTSIFLLSITPANAEQPPLSLEQQAEEIASEVKFSVTRELAKLFAFYKNTTNKTNKIMYQTRDGFDAIIYDAQKQYYDNQN